MARFIDLVVGLSRAVIRRLPVVPERIMNLRNPVVPVVDEPRYIAPRIFFRFAVPRGVIGEGCGLAYPANHRGLGELPACRIVSVGDGAPVGIRLSKKIARIVIPENGHVPQRIRARRQILSGVIRVDRLPTQRIGNRCQIIRQVISEFRRDRPSVEIPRLAGPVRPRVIGVVGPDSQLINFRNEILVPVMLKGRPAPQGILNGRHQPPRVVLVDRGGAIAVCDEGPPGHRVVVDFDRIPSPVGGPDEPPLVIVVAPHGDPAQRIGDVDETVISVISVGGGIFLRVGDGDEIATRIIDVLDTVALRVDHRGDAVQSIPFQDHSRT